MADREFYGGGCGYCHECCESEGVQKIEPCHGNLVIFGFWFGSKDKSFVELGYLEVIRIGAWYDIVFYPWNYAIGLGDNGMNNFLLVTSYDDFVTLVVLAYGDFFILWCLCAAWILRVSDQGFC